YRLDDVKKSEMLKKEMEEADQYETFFITHFAQDKSTARLTPDAKVWRLTLSRDKAGVEVEPTSITTLSSTDPVIQYFHPESNHWTKHYLVKFPKQADAQSLQFRMSGVVAQLMFEFPAHP